MIVGSCGFGSTGSSAITDYLLEYGEEKIQVLDNIEFTWVSGVDGLIDLEYHLNNPHTRTEDSIIAIERYIKRTKKFLGDYSKYARIPKEVFMNSTMEFINAITKVQWKWYLNTPTNWIRRAFDVYIMRNRIIPLIEKRLGRRINCYPMETVRLANFPNNFEEAAKTHVSQLLNAMGADRSKIIVMDQPFSGNNPQACFKYFDDAYAIVTDRDPRDNYVFSKKRLLGKSFSHLMPVDSVEEFVEYYRNIRDNQPYRQNHAKILNLQFEEMVYDYENATSKIRTFLNLPENPNPKSIFDPALSVANTQVFKRFPEFKEDIEYIERELSDYLFDFDKYADVDTSGEMFVGKSPKNRH